MYQEHPNFESPKDENVKIWRYIDFTKLVSLIDSRRLFFTRLDKFDDPFEGSYTKINVGARLFVPAGVPDEARESYVRMRAGMSEFNKNWPKFNFASCWHMNEHESAAMWKLYLKSDEGIAIQSTYARLKRSLLGEDNVHLGIIKYIDYDADFIDETNGYNVLMSKRKSFEHEREVRALLTRFPVGDLGFKQPPEEHGVAMRVDVENLIEKIYIAPSTPDWFANLVQSIIKRYGYDFEVVHSRLNEKPLF